MYKTPRTNWNQENYNIYYDTMSHERQRADYYALADVFAVAKKIPLAHEALKWAEDHNIRFHVDRHCERVGGYYQNGTGVVAIAENSFEDKHFVIGTLTHEIRHAWQDYRGLLALNEDSDLMTQIMQVALTEADAFAHGQLAGMQYSMSQSAPLQIPVDRELKKLERVAAHHYLLNQFQGWYNTAKKTQFYCQLTARSKGNDLGLMHMNALEANVEIADTKGYAAGIDLSNLDQVFSLGRAFNDAHDTYLDTKDKNLRDFFVKKALAPVWAMTEYVDPQTPPEPLMQRVRTVEKRVARMSRNFG